MTGIDASGSPRAIGIVLAGGRSARFGRDKLAEPIDGRPMLHATVEALRAVIPDIVVVGPPSGGPPIPPGVRLVRDASANEGPLAGLATGLAIAGPGPAVVAVLVAGDMPWLEPRVVAALLAALGDPRVDAVVAEVDGRARPLPMAVRVRRVGAAAEALLATGERRLRALLDRVPVAVIDEADWRPLDPEGRSFRDVDVPGDLA